jgi:hypothetical protein
MDKKFGELQDFGIEDLKRPGWATEILLGTFRKAPGSLSLSVLSHIDSMVEEGGNEALRNLAEQPQATLLEYLGSDDEAKRQLAFLAIDSALWKFAYEFNGFVELYDRARSSLIEQQFGVLAQLSAGAMERLGFLETLLPEGARDSVASLMDALSNNKLISSFYADFHGHLSGIGNLTREIEDYSVESAQFLRGFVRERFSFSKWFTLAQSALEPAQSSSPGAKTPSL